MRNIITILLIILSPFSICFGQQVWPGDVNNNGIVNHVDVLYWSVARGSSGQPRLVTITDWLLQDLPAVLWEGTFLNGLNFAYADCNGDGTVDDDDREVIEKNYGRTHGTPMPDEYATGQPDRDPPLVLSSEKPLIAPGETLRADLGLGSEEDTIRSIKGLSFTLLYDPGFTPDEDSAVSVEILEDTWMHGGETDRVDSYVKNDWENGIAEVTIYRKDKQSVGGFGPIGTFNIVMEDIVVGKSEATVTDIIAIDEQEMVFPVAPSTLYFEVDSTLTPVIRPIREGGIKLYPNPVSDWQIKVELEDTGESIHRIELFNMQGQKLAEQISEPGNHQARIRVDRFPTGMYTLKILSDRGVYVRSFIRKH